MATWTNVTTNTTHPMDYTATWQVYVENKLLWTKAEPVKKSVDMKALKEKYGDLYE